jgi:hypothetical protein
MEHFEHGVKRRGIMPARTARRIDFTAAHKFISIAFDVNDLKDFRPAKMVMDRKSVRRGYRYSVLT